MAIRLIIFDIDETLVSSKQSIINSFDYALESIGIKAREEKIISKIGFPLKRAFELILGDKKELADSLVKKYRERYLKKCVGETSIFPGVKETLEYLRNKGIRMAVATTKHVEMSVILLKGLGIDDYFEMIVGEGDYHHEKPDPESLYVIMEKLGISPQETLMVGDTVYDIEAGKLAGTKTCAVTYGIDSRKELEEYGPDFVVDKFDELKKIIS